MEKMQSIPDSAWTNDEEATPEENPLQLRIDYGVISGKVDLIEAVFQRDTKTLPSDEPLNSPDGLNKLPNPSEEIERLSFLKEMIYRAAAMRPVIMDSGGTVERKRRRNVRISSDPQTVAARKRRERVSDRLRALRKIVPGGNKMDTASMLDEAANYLKFLKSQIRVLQSVEAACSSSSSSSSCSSSSSFPSSPSCSLCPLSQLDQLFPVIGGQASKGSNPFQPLRFGSSGCLRR